MKTMTKQNPQATAERTRTRDTHLNSEKAEARKAVSSPQLPQPVLIESDEYEWTTSLNLPGLIASPTAVQPVKARESRAIWPHLDGIIETEDGDATSFCQLPGRLGSPAEIPSPGASSAHAGGLSEWAVDEYIEVTAMQLPGLLVEPIAMTGQSGERSVARGLCATCVHCDECNFPRPSSGVWRCEEYA